MAFDPGERTRPVLALNAVRLITPRAPLPACIVPFDRDALHGYLDREEQDVFAIRHRGWGMAVVPLRPDAALPGERSSLPAPEHLELVSALAREAVFRLLRSLGDERYRVVGRRPPTVEAAKLDNVLPRDLGLPDWMRKRVELAFDTRVLRPRGEAPYVVLTCSKRLRTVIDASCQALHELGVPLLGAAVTTHVDNADPKVSGRLRYAGRIIGVEGGRLTLEDTGPGPTGVSGADLFLEPTRANFNKVVTVLTQGRAEFILKRVKEAEAEWNGAPLTLETVRKTLGWIGRQYVELADGVPLEFGSPLDQADARAPFPKSTRLYKPKLSFDPGGSPETSLTWAQKGLDEIGPYDRQSFARKRPRIAVVCEAGARRETEAVVRDFLHGLPNVKGPGQTPLVPHGTGLLGRFHLSAPEIRFFPAAGDGAAAYIAAAREAVSTAAGRDERWDLALVQVRRAWQERPFDDSPYWASKAAFLKHETPVQALSIEMTELGDFPYAMALANMSLATYAKLGGVPWLLRAGSSRHHELVFGLGSHTVKEGRRSGGQRVVGITTVFSDQGHYVLDSRTAAVPFDEYPASLRATIVDAVTRIRAEEAWRQDDPVRLVFHAFIQLRRETVDAVVEAVAETGLDRVEFAFLHVVEDHAFSAFDTAATSGKGAMVPERGHVFELGEREWLVTLTGREQLKGEKQGLPDPVLLRLHERSTFRDMPRLARQVMDFASHSWRTFGPARLPITLTYADEIARQLSGLERTPNWDADAVEGSRVMRRPWFL